ncbi:MAG: hypothetical protein WD154_05470 [Nitrosopumilaceae archaeon]
MPINPLIYEQIEKLDIPPKIKNILKTMLETEEQLEVQGTKKDFVKNYENVLERFATDQEVIQYVDSYE